MGLREEKKLRQRETILLAAIELFRDRGYDDTRVQDIIDRVQVSEATFFNYFPTKDALLQEYATGSLQVYATLLRKEIDDQTRSVPDRIRDLLRIMAQGLGKEDRQFMAVVATRSRLFFGGEGAVFEQKVLAQSLLAKLFIEGQARGEIRADLDPRVLAETLTGAYTFTLVNWFIGRWGNPGSLLARMMGVADIMLSGCQTTTTGAGQPRNARKTTKTAMGALSNGGGR
ncbi:MAG: TetR/AcrR family transcriptional regulator [Dehalococcoidia bacterium]